MTKSIRFRRLAMAELAGSAEWYETQSSGLGDRFTDAVHATKDKIVDNPRRYAVVFGDIREGIVAGYPFCLYYRIRPHEIEVISVFHTSRDPIEWQSRV